MKSGAPLPCLAGAAWLVEPGFLRVVSAIEAAGGEARVVGGAVRDALVGRPVREVDIATTLVPEAVVDAARSARLKAVPTGIEHGTVTVVTGGRAYEVTTLRRDVATDGRRAVVAFTDDWDADARRRDFTFNAIYCDRRGILHDPVAGYADLRSGHVRFIGDAGQRIREDYLRILRFFRFHAELGYGALDPLGLAASERLAAGLARLSRERVQQELLRLLAAPGAVMVIETMAGHGILSALDLGVVDVATFDNLVAIEAAQGRPPESTLRLAALFLDPEAGHDASDVARRLRLSNRQRDRLIAVEGPPAVSPALTMADRRQLLYRLGDQGFRDRVLIGWARAGGAADDPGWVGLLNFADGWTAPRFPVKGRDIVSRHLAEGPEVGELLARLERHWIERDFRPSRKQLLATAGVLAADPGASGRTSG